MRTKTEEVKIYLQHYKYISRSTATRFKVYNLAEVIARLRKPPHNLEIEYQEKETRYHLILGPSEATQ